MEFEVELERVSEVVVDPEPGAGFGLEVEVAQEFVFAAEVVAEAAPVFEEVAAEIAEQAAVDTGSIAVDKPAGMDHSQDTGGNIADTVGNIAGQMLAQQLQEWLGAEDLQLLADSSSKVQLQY